MMNEEMIAPCVQWQERLAVLPPDTLSTEDKESLEAHLNSCPACALVYSQYQELSTALHDLSSGEFPSGLSLRLFQDWQETYVPTSLQRVQRKKKVRQITQRRLSMPTPTKRQVLLGIVAAILLVSFVLGSRLVTRPSSGSSNIVSAPFSGPTSVFFASSISYSHALRLITDMGLQPSLACYIGKFFTPGSNLPQPVWQPVGQKETFSQTHQIFVSTTLSAPDDWRLRLAKIPGVHLGHPQHLMCSQVISGTPSPGISVPLTSSNSGAYVRVTFRSSQTYDSALYTVINLGLGLVNECYEKMLLTSSSGIEPPWQFTGQEQQFAKEHFLIVETEKRVTSGLWQTQLQLNPNIVSVKVPYNFAC